MEFNWFNIDTEQRGIWEAFCPPGEFRVVSPDALPGPLPTALAQKFDSVLVMASGDPGGVAFWMLNGNRPERPTKKHPQGAIDQQPFGLAFLGDAPLGSGCLVQHGDWDDRTSHAPPGFWPQVEASGLGHGFPLPEMPVSPAGYIEDLAVRSQYVAFEVLVASIRWEFI